MVVTMMDLARVIWSGSLSELQAVELSSGRKQGLDLGYEYFDGSWRQSPEDTKAGYLCLLDLG